MGHDFSFFSDKGKKLTGLLHFIYGARLDEAKSLISQTINKHSTILKKLNSNIKESKQNITSKDALFIVYGDMISDIQQNPGKDKLTALHRLSLFLDNHMEGLFSFLHILPFYPYSSDDGFSVIDYREVNKELGSWEDVGLLGKNRKLVFDFVINHASSKSAWFKAFKAEEMPYSKYFITRPLDYEHSSVLRPRTHPLISAVKLNNGKTIGVWTTFSDDQIDINFSEPAVLAEFIDIMLFYAEQGARMLRLDAIAYLWKKDGTSCAHLPETHAIVKVLRNIIDNLGLDILLLTETNVEHKDNISYFGKGDEAHIVYNFSLAPLVLYAFVTEDATALAKWAGRLTLPENALMLNFLASHDGIGVMPVQGLVDNYEVVLKAVKDRGGLISMKATKDGPIPYELNISWMDAVSAPGAKAEEKVAALLASYGIAFAMDGLPAVYFHSALGSSNWTEYNAPRN